MENLRVTAEKDLGETLEGEFAMPVQITYADGEKQIYKKNTTTLLSGQILYFTRGENPVTGELIVVNKPVVSLRISSLDTVPVAGEKIVLTFATSPVVGAPVYDWVCMADKAVEDGSDIGFMRFYPQNLEEQTPEDYES